MSVRADANKLRDTARKLMAAGQQMEQMQRQALAALRSSGWEDGERQRFEAELSRDMKSVTNIARKLQNDYPKTLERKARALDDFKR